MSDSDLPASDLVQIALFRVGCFSCGLPIDSIQEINRNLELTPVHEAPSYVRGIINLRGNIVTVIDVRRKLGLEPTTIGRETRNVIIEQEGELVGLLVDAVDDIVECASSSIQPTPAHLERELGAAFEGVIQLNDELVTLLELQHYSATSGGDAPTTRSTKRNSYASP